MLQEATTETEEEEFVLTACTESGIKVTVTGMSSALPCPAEEITVTAEEKDTETEEDQLFPDPMEEEQESELIGKYLLDITLKHGEEEIEPTGPVKVTFSGLQVEGCDPKIYHIDPEEQEVTDMEVDTEENGDMTITTDHFSLYQIELRATEAVAETTPGTLKGYIGNNVFKDGGTFVLEGDAFTAEGGSQANLTISQDTIIDLEGHKLTISQPGQQFEIQQGATLTILDSATKDSAAADKIVATESGSSKLYGNAATLEDNGTLTYYITRSAPKNDGTGTRETLEKHELDLTNTGIIENSADAGGDQIFWVNGGTLNLESGVLRNKADNKRLVCVSGGAFQMSGGYIVGGKRNEGGGVYISNNGTMKMKAGVIAANKSNLGGGIYAGGGTLDLSGGVVTGNQVVKSSSCGSGGGIFVTNATLNLSDEAYVTNNILQQCNCPENDVNNTHGGGGITIGNGSTMNMFGGYVTGNDAWLAGGGIYAGFCDNPITFAMSGGTIAGNHVEKGEGGGLRIAGRTNGVIKADNKIYITNNKTETPDDWGGGGIFVQHKGTLNITNALITENSAGGFGGGIAVCPTGETLIVHSEGGAVYDNHAEGTNMSGGGHNKTYDTDLAKASKVFRENGYQDFFCVRSKDDANNEVSLVTGEMLGDGAANWEGSCDEQPVKISKSGYAAAKYLFGLTSHPDADAIASAKKAANVIISGNHSNIHGGGIMTNGGLILGTIEENIVSETPSLNISGTKVLLKDGAPQRSERNFDFQLTDENGNVVGKATADPSTGVFTISPDKTYMKEGKNVYYLSEVQDNRAGVEYDTAKYKIEVQITKNTTTLLGVDFVSYKVSPETVTVTKVEDPSSSVSFAGTLNADGSYLLQIKDPAFTNTMTTPLALKLVKTDKDNPAKYLPGATFKLQKADGTTLPDATTNDDGEATFSGIEKNTIYYLYETVPPTGYMTAGPWILEIQDNTGTFYPAQVKADGTLEKTADAGTGTPFNVMSEDTIVLEMKISDQSWGYKLPDTGGLGTTGYRTGGLALVVCALAWKYILTKRRKEDEISS